MCNSTTATASRGQQAGRLGVCALAAALTMLAAGPARADIVRLTNGRIMSVEKAVFDGDMVILMMRGGGEIRAARTLVAELLPDEVPFARSVAIESLAASIVTRGPRMAREAVVALVDRVAGKVGLDRRIAHAVVRAESNYDPAAISPKGAMGLMQLMPVVARQYDLSDPFHPEQNLEAGMRHLRHLLGRFDLSRALAAYNAGEGAVSRYGGVPPYRETQEYVRKIRAMLR
jgi:soluble lytic murein transglycosylase-like protein